MADCNFSNSTFLAVNSIKSMLSVTSLVMCVLAIALLTYYKLYCSFHHRLILYMLIAFLIDTIAGGLQIPFIWYRTRISEHQTIGNLCDAVSFIELYCAWNIQLSVAFMTAEVFTFIVFSKELQKAEVPLTVFCFAAPLVVPISRLVQRTDYGMEEYYWCGFAAVGNDTEQKKDFFKYILPGIAIMGVCSIALAIAMVWLAYWSLQGYFKSRKEERQHLLVHKNAASFKKALKQSLPFIIYPAVFDIALILIYLNLIRCFQQVLYIYVIIRGGIGSLASTIFFVHVKALGPHKRNMFKRKSSDASPTSRVGVINESQEGAHDTTFYPLGESDVHVEGSIRKPACHSMKRCINLHM